MNPAETTNTAMTAMRRPAVYASTLVRSDVEHTFDVFIHTIAAWWPVRQVSAGGDRVRAVTVEPHEGGRVYETWDDGTTKEWGEILAWQPPHRFTMTWRSTPIPTEIELGFTQIGPALTRVTVEHRGWEKLTEQQLREDCSAPGGYSTGSYDHGWKLVLDSFASSVELSGMMACEMTGSGKRISSSVIRSDGLHRVLPVNVCFRPTTATISPGPATSRTSRRSPIMRKMRATRSLRPL